MFYWDNFNLYFMMKSSSWRRRWTSALQWHWCPAPIGQRWCRLSGTRHRWLHPVRTQKHKNSSHFSQNSSLNTIICNDTRQGSVEFWPEESRSYSYACYSLERVCHTKWDLTLIWIDIYINRKSLVSVLWKRSKVSLMSQKSHEYGEWTTAMLLSGGVLIDWLIGKKICSAYGGKGWG